MEESIHGKSFSQPNDLARKQGFDNINIDLISAIPGQTEASWKKTLTKAASLDPEHISAYSLIIEEGTPFYERYGKMPDKVCRKVMQQRIHQIA